MLGALLLHELNALCDSGWKPEPRPWTLPCERCGSPSTHRPVTHGEQISGWSVLCCGCADTMMVLAGSTVDEPDRSEGLRSWVATHAGMCGPHWLRAA